MASPRLEINFHKLAHNVLALSRIYESKGIEVIGVCKAVCGYPEIAQVLLNSGIKILGDSRILNIKRMRLSGITAPMVLIRTPLKSELSEVIEHCQISHNTEYSIIKGLSDLAVERNLVHQIILMVELGDLREGILPTELYSLVAKILKLKGVKIVGLGGNLACFGGIEPNDENMGELSRIAAITESQLNYKLTYVSGGNSANYVWSLLTKNVQRINYLRLGESIYLGCDPLTRKAIPGLHTDAFSLFAEVIESGIKPSVPNGSQKQNAFGETPNFKKQGLIHRAILGVGLQDVAVSGLTPYSECEILGASSDHLIVDTKNKKIKVGAELKFGLNYAALLSAMTSPYVTKNETDTMNAFEYCQKVEQHDLDIKLLWPRVVIAENNSALVSLKDVGLNLIYEPSFRKNYRYLVREELVEKIGTISKALDEQDKRLVIRSAWRSFEHQRLIWENKIFYLMKEHPEKTTQEIHYLVSHFIAPAEKSMHSTGGSVDGLIYDLKRDCVMDYGTNTGLDIDLNDKCFPYHPDISAEAAQNRKQLIGLFEKEGFLCDAKEYWHFDYGNAVWAAKKDLNEAFYGVVGDY